MFDLNQELNKNSPRNLTESEAADLKNLEEEWGSILGGDQKKVTGFIMPFIKGGFTPEQINGLLKKIPADWSPDHREMYYDFRLARWIQHIEPKDLRDTVKEYLVNAGSLEEGVLYVQKILADLTKKIGSSESE